MLTAPVQLLPRLGKLPRPALWPVPAVWCTHLRRIHPPITVCSPHHATPSRHHLNPPAHSHHLLIHIVPPPHHVTLSLPPIAQVLDVSREDLLANAFAEASVLDSLRSWHGSVKMLACGRSSDHQVTLNCFIFCRQ